MLAAVHPQQPSAPLVEALLAAGYRPVPVADAAAMADQEPEAGWAALVVELGEDPTAALALARRVHREGSAPVLVVANRALAGILPPDAGDDFLLSPIDPAELALRLQRLRAPGGDEPAGETLRFKDLELNLATYQARLAGIPLDLTYMEYELLRFFAGHPTRVWSREQLLSRVWGYDYFGGARTVDVHVRRLRAKLGETRASWITTVRSVGYRFG
jgi:two-component system alkaline phosphatase synthesis response regulator PhoP